MKMVGIYHSCQPSRHELQDYNVMKYLTVFFQNPLIINHSHEVSQITIMKQK